MSLKDSNVEYIDTRSSGDFNEMNPKQSKEVNNNEVDALSKEFGEMGCIVDAVKRPPNICVENCVYESESENDNENDKEDAYSDEFEEDQSGDESVQIKEDKVKVRSLPVPVQSMIKLSKSQSSVSSNKPPSVSDRSGRSNDCGSSSGSYSRRINMSFSNERLREIERHNHILLTKIMSVRNTKKSSIPSREQPVKRPVPAAALARKNQQKQIDHDNMILLKKIQRAKSSALSMRR